MPSYNYKGDTTDASSSDPSFGVLIWRKQKAVFFAIDQVVGTIEGFRKSGLEHLALSFRDVRLFKDENPDLLLQQMRLFAREIMPAFRA